MYMPESDTLDCNLSEDDLDTLIYNIKQKNCILMLGPDTATETVDGVPILLTETLANQLSEKIDSETLKRINTSDLAQVSQHYVKEKGPKSLESKAFSFYKTRQDLCSPLHQDLAALPFYFTITTTPDSMFLNALKKEKKQPVMCSYNFKGKNPEPVQMGTIENPLVFYLYGSIEEPNSLLLTENDLLDFLAALISEKPPLPDKIRVELQDENKIFLFLGFGFKHWYLRILLYALQGKNKKNPSIDLEHTVFFFKKSDYKIHIFKEDFNVFAENLRKIYSECSSDVVSRLEAKNMPEVFISYTSEDKEYANSLHKKFEQAGMRPWLDKENLRGGDHWDKRIRDTINKVDYFVVLQSNALTNKIEGYVNLEINEALERLKYFQSGKSLFVIPIIIDGCPLRDDLKKLHATDLNDNKSMKKLIDSIQRDFEKRKSLNK
jgi:hypothetical protein